MRRGLLILCVIGCDSVEERPATWSYLHASVIAPSCATASCHSKVSSAKGIDLSSRTSAYAMLVGRTCDAPELPGEPERNFVRPYDPAGSQLMYMLRGEQIIAMPPDQPLAGTEIELIERWIAEGAPCD